MSLTAILVRSKELVEISINCMDAYVRNIKMQCFQFFILLVYDCGRGMVDIESGCA